MSAGEPFGEAPGEGRGPGGAVGDTPETPEGGGRGAGRGRFGSGFRPSGDTPLVKNGTTAHTTIADKPTSSLKTRLTPS